MSWLYLILAIIFETIATTLLKMSNGFSALLPSIGTIFGYICCFAFLSYALKQSIWASHMQFGVLLALY